MPAGHARAVGFADLQALGLIDHPDCHRYADDLFALNFPYSFRNADRLCVRISVNKIGQIPASVAQGVGYTLLPRSGLAAFPQADHLRIAATKNCGRSFPLAIRQAPGWTAFWR